MKRPPILSVSSSAVNKIMSTIEPEESAAAAVLYDELMNW